MPSSLIDQIMSMVGPEVTNQLSSNLNVDQKTAQSILPQVAPLILGGLKRQMETHGGADRANHILNKYGDESVLDNIAGLFSNKAQDTSPDPRLGGLLGDSGVQASNMLSQQFNLDKDTAMKLIPMLAPIILGALSRMRNQKGVGAQGIASLIDQNGDGQILDDVARFLMAGLSGSSTGTAGSRSAGGGLLGGLLGGLFGGRKR